MSLKQKLLIPIILVTTAIMITVGVINYSIMSKQTDTLYKKEIDTAVVTIENQLNLSSEMTSYITGLIDEKNLALSRAFSEIVKQNPSLIEKTDEMIRLATLLDVNEVHVTDDKGVLQWGNIEGFYGFDFTTSDQTLEFLQILDDPSIEIAQAAQPNGATGAMFQYIGVARTDSLGEGIVQVGIDASVIDNLNAMLSIQKMIDKTKIGENGYISIINKNGEITAHNDKTQIGKTVSSEPWFKSLTTTDSSDNKGDGFMWTEIEGEQFLATIKKSGDDFIMCALPEGEYKGDLNELIKSTVMTTVIFSAFNIIILFLCISVFAIKPIKQITKAMGFVAKGNLSTKVAGKYTGEFGVLSSSLNGIIDMLNRYIAEINKTLVSFSNDDYTAEVREEYIGDFAPIKTGFNDITTRINTVMRDIKGASSGVSSGAGQIASGASRLATGAIEQTQSIDELSDFIDSLNAGADETLSISVTTAEATENAKHLMGESITLMNDLDEAMAAINSSTDEIAKIIKTIDEISSQTNIIALNAAVEAARAGEAGKGFSIVADEVRRLAAKSAEAAKDTAALIEESTQNVRLGSDIANKTKQSIEGVVKVSQVNNDGMLKLRESAKKQHEEISHLINNLDTIKNVVGENTSTAEQSAAQAEEMAAQSVTMSQIVDKFKTKS